MEITGYARLKDEEQTKVKVNWRKDGRVGYTQVEGVMEGFSNVADEDELEWPWGMPKSSREKFSLADLSDDELRERLKKTRREIRDLMQNKQSVSATNKGSSDPKKRRKTVSRKSVQNQISQLSDKEKEMLKEIIGDDN